MRRLITKDDIKQGVLMRDHGYTYRQIGEALGFKEASIRVRVDAAIKERDEADHRFADRYDEFMRKFRNNEIRKGLEIVRFPNGLFYRWAKE